VTQYIGSGIGNTWESALSYATETLEVHLADWHKAGGREDVAATVQAMAAAACELAAKIAVAPLDANLNEPTGKSCGGAGSNSPQKQLDVEAHKIFRTVLEGAPVAVLGSEDLDEAEVLDPTRGIALAMDPLDGSSNIDTNLSIGTIFSIFPVPASGTGSIDTALMQPGRNQLAAGFFIYGPQTALVLTLRSGTHIFTLDRNDGKFHLSKANVKIPSGSTEYAINASNYRRWPAPVREYVDDLIAGSQGPRGKDFNMRWLGSIVAEAFRMMARGGIYLYPRDEREGFEKGRHRLVYEANPLALVFEEAGGAASDGVNRTLDMEPTGLHQRVPLILGSADKVERVARYYKDAPARAQRSPLFNERGLFRA